MRNGLDSDFTPLTRWLFERRMFHEIYDLAVFAKFRYVISREHGLYSVEKSLKLSRDIMGMN